ncbi:MAG: DUF1285 domain-containing protein [Rhodospirillales bacterium]
MDPKSGASMTAAQARQKAAARGLALAEGLDMRIAADGTWFHDGRPIRREGLVRLFAGVLERDADGAFWLVTPAEMGVVEVEDAPFAGVELTVEGEGALQKLSVRTNLDNIVVMDAEHPLTMRQGRPYVLVRGRLEARLTRAVWHTLAGLAEEIDGGGYAVRSCGAVFPLDTPLDASGEERAAHPDVPGDT